MTPAEDRALWERRYSESQSVWGWAPNRFVAEVLAPMPPGRVLDLACGEGRNALWLATLGWRATAVDFAENALARGRAQAAEHEQEHDLQLTWVHADVLAYVPEPSAYDAVVIAYLHLGPDKLATVLRHAESALAPGGTLVVVGHDVTNIADGVGGPQDPGILYTPELVTERLSEGLRVTRAERVFRQTDRAPQPAIDTLVVATREARS